MAKTPLKVAGFVFFVVALLHLSRLIWKFDLIISSSSVPIWANGLAFFVALGLSIWMLQTAKKV